ncbi:MAG TPA: M48 family metalloprotease [Terriglobia bacterium]|nr:M48 family metalloprotease [Terriglobia bacterium]
MKKALIAALAAALFLITLPLLAQQSSGGWAAPCNKALWKDYGFQYDAMRVCRVATYLVVGLNRYENHPITLEQARQTVNEGFRICWGQFPSSGGYCASVNAWTTAQGWLHLKPNVTPKPVVITLTATEWLQSDDDVAFVLGHEMGHANDSGQSTTVNTEQNEERADAIGMGFLMFAGYDARASAQALELIKGERGQGLAGNLGGMFQAGLQKLLNPSEPHPLNSARIQLMKREFARLCVTHGNQPIGCKEGWH